MYKKHKNLSKKTAPLKQYFNGLFIGLQIITDKNQELTTNEFLNVAPTIIIYDNATKILVDYKKSPEKDIEKIKNFFSSLSIGAQFTIQNAIYLNERSSKTEADLSGTYTLISFSGDVISANVVNVNNINLKEKTYQQKYFTSIPTFNKSTNEELSIISYQLINHSGIHAKNSFRNALPILNGDLLVLDTPLNKGKYKIVSYEVKDEIEFLKINTINEPLLAEDLIGTAIVIQLLRNNFSYDYLNTKDKEKVQSIRNEFGTKEETRGICCLYKTEKYEDPDTGHMFDSGDLFSCKCRADWECVSVANKSFMNYKFLKDSGSFCSIDENSCNGYSVFPASPNDSIEERCSCCPINETSTIKTEELGQTKPQQRVGNQSKRIILSSPIIKKPPILFGNINSSALNYSNTIPTINTTNITQPRLRSTENTTTNCCCWGIFEPLLPPGPITQPPGTPNTTEPPLFIGCLLNGNCNSTLCINCVNKIHPGCNENWNTICADTARDECSEVCSCPADGPGGIAPARPEECPSAPNPFDTDPSHYSGCDIGVCCLYDDNRKLRQCIIGSKEYCNWYDSTNILHVFKSNKECKSCPRQLLIGPSPDR